LIPGKDVVWKQAHSMLGAGPQLIKAGKIAITDKQEKMVEGLPPIVIRETQ
jgi:hypothetical protein